MALRSEEGYLTMLAAIALASALGLAGGFILFSLPPPAAQGLGVECRLEVMTREGAAIVEVEDGGSGR